MIPLPKLTDFLCLSHLIPQLQAPPFPILFNLPLLSSPLLSPAGFMASLPKPSPVRKLHELLQEQQEPFLLDVYLHEKGYPKKTHNVEPTTTNCWPGDSSCKNLQSLSRKNSKKMREDNPKCSRRLKSVFFKLVPGKNQGISNHGNRNSDHGKFGGSGAVVEMKNKDHQIAEADRFSSASSSTVFGSCVNSDTEDSHFTPKCSSSPCAMESFEVLKLPNLKEPEVVTDGKLQSGFTEDCKQLSPVSVLELESDEGSPIHYHRQFYTRRSKEENPSTSNFKVSEESIFSGSLWDFLLQSLVENQGIGILEFQEIFGFGSSSQYLKSKRVLQQTKQLLFDCVKEVVETHGKKRMANSRFGFYQPCLVQEYLGPDQLGQIICEQIYSWGRKPSDITNITQLLEEDFSQSALEWSHFSPQIKEIGIEIEDAIFADIRDDLVLEIMGLWKPRKC